MISRGGSEQAAWLCITATPLGPAPACHTGFCSESECTAQRRQLQLQHPQPGTGVCSSLHTKHAPPLPSLGL